MKLLLQNKTTYCHKVKAHKDIEGNKKVDVLTKWSLDGQHEDVTKLYHIAHSTPYWLYRDEERQPKQPLKTPFETFKNT